MLKYYFGYKSTMGLIFNLLWVEEDGVAVGGPVICIQGNKYEITAKEFAIRDTASLKEKYPYNEPKLD